MPPKTRSGKAEPEGETDPKIDTMADGGTPIPDNIPLTPDEDLSEDDKDDKGDKGEPGDESLLKQILNNQKKAERKS